MPKYLQKRRRRWYAILEIPKDISSSYRGKRRLVQSLDTESLTTAERLVLPIIATWKASFEATRSGSPNALLELEVLANEWREDFKQATQDELETYEDILQEKVDELSRNSQDKAESFASMVRDQSRPTTEFVEEWLSISDNQPKTIDMKRSDVIRFSETFPYTHHVAKKGVQKWTHKLLYEDNLNPSTVRRIVSACRGYWSFLERSGYIHMENDPFRDAVERTKRKTKVSRAKDRQPFTAKEAVFLFNAATTNGDLDLANLIWLGMWTGCRIEELCALKVVDVLPDHFRVTDAKSGAGIRSVPIHSQLRDTIEKLTSESTDGFVMSDLKPNKYGDRSNAIGKRFGRLKTKLGFSETHVFHSIRKTVATMLENAGVPESVAADIIGHEKKTMTYGVYSGGTSFEIMQREIEKLEYPNIDMNGTSPKQN